MWASLAGPAGGRSGGLRFLRDPRGDGRRPGYQDDSSLDAGAYTTDGISARSLVVFAHKRPAAVVAFRALQRRFRRDEAALTPREREVLTLVAEGLSTAQIAEVLGISTQTVRTHIKNIRKKLAAPTAAHAVAIAMERELIHPRV